MYTEKMTKSNFTKYLQFLKRLAKLSDECILINGTFAPIKGTYNEAGYHYASYVGFKNLVHNGIGIKLIHDLSNTLDNIAEAMITGIKDYCFEWLDDATIILTVGDRKFQLTSSCDIRIEMEKDERISRTYGRYIQGYDSSIFKEYDISTDAATDIKNGNVVTIDIGNNNVFRLAKSNLVYRSILRKDAPVDFALVLYASDAFESGLRTVIIGAVYPTFVSKHIYDIVPYQVPEEIKEE